MASTRFANRYRKDTSTEMIRTKAAHRKSLSQKENRHKEFERSRQLSLKDVNIPLLEGRTLSPLDEIKESTLPGKGDVKSKKSVDQRKELLRRYKEEKQLQKLKEQREKAKRDVFKVGRFRPVAPAFLVSAPLKSTGKAEPKKPVASTSVRLTRAKVKEQAEQNKIYVDPVGKAPSTSVVRAIQRPTTDNRVVGKARPAVAREIPTSANVRLTRSAAAATRQISKTAGLAPPRKLNAAADNQPQRKATGKERPLKQIEVKADATEHQDCEAVSADPAEEPTETFQNPAAGEIEPDQPRLEKNNEPERNGPPKERERISFAPKDFRFWPLDGLKIYSIAPKTTLGADVQGQKVFAWSPLKTDAAKTQETVAQTREAQSTIPTPPNGDELPSPSDRSLKANEDTTGNFDRSPNRSEPPLPASRPAAPAAEPQHDVPYFRRILQSETEKLTTRCHEWEKKLELDIPEDAKDLIRTTVGQTRLLMTERFRQFEGLVDDCDLKRGQRETTCTDLDGFWDMVHFQIDDVIKRFDTLNERQENGWREVNPPSRKVVRKKAVPSGTGKPREMDAVRAAARSRLAAIKASMREKIKPEEPAGDGLASALPEEGDKIVFDAGFFRIESPAKSLSASSPRVRFTPSHGISQPRATPSRARRSPLRSSAARAIQTTAPRPDRAPADSDPPADEVRRPGGHGSVEMVRDTVAEDVRRPGSEVAPETSHKSAEGNLRMDHLSESGPGQNPSPSAARGEAEGEREDETSEEPEAMDLNSSGAVEDVVMSTPEKSAPSPGTDPWPAERARGPTRLSGSFRGKSVASEWNLLESPDPRGDHDPFAHRPCESQRSRKTMTLGADLIQFSPLLSREEKPEGF
ncbi:disks large-associated protein 5 isoform X2 [Ornithorhynchus anatinus]|uniref:disks large-associated protein 5 isoform X2 n=1 Tax=Ornithorhynchus anatinus TaxID=9258 RepID=UPI0019D44E74|nr:disks large-associated protein 5 isoform X2 [Ornithorhynchus anatinus]